MSLRSLSSLTALYLVMTGLVFFHCGRHDSERPDLLEGLLTLADLEQVDEALSDEAAGEGLYKGVLSLLRHRVSSDSEETTRMRRRFADHDRAMFHLTPEGADIEIETVSLDGEEMIRRDSSNNRYPGFRPHRRMIRPRFPTFWIEDFELEPSHDYSFNLSGDLPAQMTIPGPAYYPMVEGITAGESFDRGQDLNIIWGGESNDRARVVLFAVPWFAPEQRNDLEARKRLRDQRPAVVLKFAVNPGQATITADMLGELPEGRALLSVAVGRRIESDGGNYLARAESVQTIPLLLE